MANPLDTPVKMVNAAAVSLVGADPITAFSDGSAIGKAMGESYETIVRECLSTNRWRFNMKKAQLVRLAQAPLETYSAAYQMPVDCLILHSVSVGGRELGFDWFGGEIHCDAEPADAVVADYSWRSPESAWTPLFVEYVRHRIAYEIALGPARAIELAVALARETELKRRFAGSMEAQSRTTRALDVNALRDVRRR